MKRIFRRFLKKFWLCVISERDLKAVNKPEFLAGMNGVFMSTRAEVLI